MNDLQRKVLGLSAELNTFLSYSRSKNKPDPSLDNLTAGSLSGVGYKTSRLVGPNGDSTERITALPEDVQNAILRVNYVWRCVWEKRWLRELEEHARTLDRYCATFGPVSA
ncbi:MAG: hypothetical protein JJ916_04235 [Phycisphaerales bacterium]|nr:hypothetical protein [Phycisphaerales bacterium]